MMMLRAAAGVTMALRRGDIAAMEIIVRFDVFYGKSLFPTRRCWYGWWAHLKVLRGHASFLLF